MSDNKTDTRRGEFSRAFKIDDIDLKRRNIENALPAYFVEEYPDFVDFLTVYYDFLEAEEGLDRVIDRLIDVRNPDIAKDDNKKRLRKEYGPGFPNIGTLDDSTAMKIFEKWYKSKGNKEAMEAYFRIFLNSEAEVIYPKDNMLRVSDGNWSEERGEYVDSQGHLSETTMLIQDSNFYQIFSYLIRSGVSIADWGPNFRKLAHPAGWNLFGEVRLEELALFEYETASPTVVPGFQVRDANLLILGAALFFVVGQFDQAPTPHRSKAFAHYVRKFWDVNLASFEDTLTLQDVNKNILLSTYTVGGLRNLQISNFESPTDSTIRTNQQRPARIVIS